MPRKPATTIQNTAPGRDVAEAYGGRERGGERLEVGDLAGIIGLRVAAANACDGVAEGAQVDELEAQGEEQGAQDQPEDDGGNLDAGGPGGVPEPDIEEEHRRQRVDEPQAEVVLEGVHESDGLIHDGLPRGAGCAHLSYIGVGRREHKSCAGGRAILPS